MKKISGNKLRVVLLILTTLIYIVFTSFPYLNLIAPYLNFLFISLFLISISGLNPKLLAKIGVVGILIILILILMNHSNAAEILGNSVFIVLVVASILMLVEDLKE